MRFPWRRDQKTMTEKFSVIHIPLLRLLVRVAILRGFRPGDKS